MNITSFKESLSNNAPPPHTSAYLQALWYDGKGLWDKAHDIIQDVEDKNAAWIHAYLHRKEGDNWNADYWYRKAGKVRPAATLQQEWEHIVLQLL